MAGGLAITLSWELLHSPIAQLGQRCEGRIQVALGADTQNVKRNPEASCDRANADQRGFCIGIVRIDDQAIE